MGKTTIKETYSDTWNSISGCRVKIYVLGSKVQRNYKREVYGHKTRFRPDGHLREYVCALD